MAHHGKHFTSPFSSFPLDSSVCSRQWAGHTEWTSLAVPGCLCLMAASPGYPYPWLSLSVFRPGGHIAARQLQPGQGRQVRLSWLQNLCRAVAGTSIWSSNRALALMTGAKAPSHGLCSILSTFRVRAGVTSNCESKQDTDRLGTAFPNAFCVCLRHEQRSGHNCCRTSLHLPVLFKQPASIALL